MKQIQFQITNSWAAMCLLDEELHQFESDKSNETCCQCGSWTVEDMKIINDKLKFIAKRDKSVNFY